nr:NUDIX domain-containing protein [Chloroflexota bacterium]
MNQKGEILLLHRANDPSIPAPNTWGLVGGHVEPGETLEEALRREVEEEIRFHLESYQPFGEFHDEEFERYVYIGPIDKELHQLHLGEGQSFGFFSPQYALTHLPLSEPTRKCLIVYAQTFKRSTERITA